MKNKINEQTKMTGLIRVIKENVITGVKTIQIYKNVICTVGKTAIGRRLINTALKTNEGMITYGATGTGNTTPAATDIKLTTEISRKQIASSYYTANVITIRTFFNTSNSNGNIEEFGLFGEDATSTTDSGTMFNHVLISLTKTSSETLTVECEITIA